MWVLSRPCFQGKLATISYKTSTQKKKFLNEKTWPMLFFDVSETPKKIQPHFFKFLAHFQAFTPPCLWLYLKKFLAKHFKIIKYQCTIVILSFAKSCLKLEKMNKLFPLNLHNHEMAKRNIEKYKVIKAKTERYKSSAVLNIQRMLNDEESENMKTYKAVVSNVLRTCGSVESISL